MLHGSAPVVGSDFLRVDQDIYRELLRPLSELRFRLIIHLEIPLKESLRLLSRQERNSKDGPNLHHNGQIDH